MWVLLKYEKIFCEATAKMTNSANHKILTQTYTHTFVKTNKMGENKSYKEMLRI